MRLIPIDADNVDAAEAMAREIFPDEDHAGVFWPRAGYDESIALGWPRFRYYVADVGGVPVGLTGHYPKDAETDDLWVGWFGILPRFRRRGFGSALFDATRKLIADLGQNHVELYSGADDADAHRLYLRAGLRVSDTGRIDGRPVLFFSSRTPDRRTW